MSIALGATGLIALAGCGSSSSSSSSSTSAAAGGGGNASAPSESSSQSSFSVPTVPGGGSFCQQAAAVVAQLRSVPAEAAAATSLDTLKQLIARDASAVDSLDGSAPSEIAADLHTLRVAIDQASSSMQSVTSLDQIDTAFAPLGTPAVKTASDHLGAYGQSACGIAPASSATT